MKRIVFCLFTAVCFLPALSQQKFMDKNFQITRVPLKEKFNLPATPLPALLIQAFCEGKITGYYPHRPDLACSYHEFAAHFNIKQAQPAGRDDAYEEVKCPQEFCSTKNDEYIRPFTFYFDVIEEKGFNAQTSSKKQNIRYIRLAYVTEKKGMEIIYPGPLLNYQDVIAISSPEYTLLNTKNDAARISFKQYFESRMFTGFPLNSSGAPKQQNPNREKDKWEH